MSAIPTAEQWVVMWHPLGAMRVLQVRTMLAENQLKMIEGAKDGFLVVDVAETFEAARELEKEWRKKKRAARAAAEDKGDDEFGPVPMQ